MTTPHVHAFEPVDTCWIGSRDGYRLIERCVCGAERPGPLVETGEFEHVAQDLGRPADQEARP